MDMRARIDAGDMSFTARVGGGEGFPAQMVPAEAAAPDYGGPYEVVPSRSEQVLPMRGRRARQDVTVHPIPSNYGLITWDGRTITVS